MQDRLYLNTHDPNAAAVAKKLGFGIELDDYLYFNNTIDSDEGKILFDRCSGLTQGCEKLFFHGIILGTDLKMLAKASTSDIMALCNQSFTTAGALGINHIVYHSDYIPGHSNRREWIRRSVALWQEFMSDKPGDLRIYIENFVDNDPDIMAELCEKINDKRVMLCLDTGHACSNSNVDVVDWVNTLGSFIGHVHIHNNDGNWDYHWPLGKGILDMEQILHVLESKVPSTTYTIEADYSLSLQWLAAHGFLVEHDYCNEALSGKLELYRLLDEGRAAVRAGKQRPLQEAMKDVKQGIRIP